MGEQTQISSTIEELQNVITHLPKTKQKQYADALTAISNRLHSVELKLAVIGNFSCGKSTAKAPSPRSAASARGIIF